MSTMLNIIAATVGVIVPTASAIGVMMIRKGRDVRACREILHALLNSDRNMTGLEICEYSSSVDKGDVYAHLFRMENVGMVQRHMVDNVSTNGVNIRVPVPMHTFSITERGRRYILNLDKKSSAAFDEEFDG